MDSIDIVFLDAAVDKVHIRVVNHTTDQWAEMWLDRNADGGLTLPPEVFDSVGISDTEGAMVFAYDADLNELPMDQWRAGEGE